MDVRENADLRPFNTLGLRARTRYLAVIENQDQALGFAREPRFQGLPHLVLGGGSNVLFRRDFEGVVGLVKSRGIETRPIDREWVDVRAAAGENWHHLVQWSINSGLCGLENLALIPGSVGAAPIQNIGAYGVELSERFHCLEAIDLSTGTTRRFEAHDCGFGYRSSTFKLTQQERYLISSVTLRLSRKLCPVLSYAGVREELERRTDGPPTASGICSAICALRRQKLPDPATLGNVGSFFKNPEIEAEHCASLRARFPSLPAYPTSPGRCKVSAAWLIEKCGWKGRRWGDVGVYEHHALVLVNYGSASGSELWALATAIQESVTERFDITLDPEPRVV